MKVGITEYGDAGIDLRWVKKLPKLDGAILISKNFTKEFKENVLSLYKNNNIILHCTCTGFGGTKLEPNVPDYKTQLNSLKELIDAGFPAENVVLRLDPIFPCKDGIERVKMVLDYFISLNLNVNRIRMSVVDEYDHVKRRYKKYGWAPLYGVNFNASDEQLKMVGDFLSKYPFKFETCAEEKLSLMYPEKFVIQGCISQKDLDIMNLVAPPLWENPQHRTGCHCLSCKTEMLTPRKPCAHNCVYCFWKEI